jgi:hypothetical protein
VEPDGSRPNRTSTWALVVGGLGVVVAIVALVIAIGAKNDTRDDTQLTKAVNAQAAQAVDSVRGELKRDVRAANTTLVRLRASSAAAKRTRVALKRATGANSSGVANNRVAIGQLQQSVDTLNDQVADLRLDLRSLQQRVRTLEQQPASNANSDGG